MDYRIEQYLDPEEIKRSKYCLYFFANFSTSYWNKLANTVYVTVSRYKRLHSGLGVRLFCLSFRQIHIASFGSKEIRTETETVDVSKDTINYNKDVIFFLLFLLCVD
jgi:hypothetical protein